MLEFENEEEIEKLKLSRNDFLKANKCIRFLHVDYITERNKMNCGGYIIMRNRSKFRD